jgi:TetR/AcrR family transcriptional regulator, cholesterol catabolism regulator
MHTRLNVKQSAPIWRKEDRTDHIYRVAAEVMCQKGYQATSMNDIAEAVGLTKAGVYHYIRGKEDLLFQIMSFGMDMVDADVIAPAREVADPEARLRTIIERHCRRIMEQGGAVTILLEEMSALSAAHQRIIRNRKRAYFELVRDTVEELSAEGKLRDLDPTVVSFGLFGMILWTSRWYRRGGDLPPQRAVPDLVEMVMNGVLKVRAAAPRKAPSGGDSGGGGARRKATAVLADQRRKRPVPGGDPDPLPGGGGKRSRN